jgi:hypothetical protein
MTDEIIACHVCRHTFVYRGRQSDLNGNFCSLPCQAWYDAGNAPVAAEIIYRWGDKPLQKSADGFKIACAHCCKDFDSKGLRCCSVECERAYRQREETWPSWPRPASSPKPSAAVSAVMQLSRPGAREDGFPAKRGFVARIAAQKAVLE